VKYAEAGVLPSEASKWWEGFLDDFEQSFGSCPPVAPAWYLSELSAIRQSYKSPTQPPLNIPEKILSVHKSQMQQTSTVSQLHCTNIYI